MKKFLIFVITILYAGIAFGEDSSIATANTESKVLIDNHGVYNSKVVDSPILTNLNPLNLNTPGIYRNQSSLNSSFNEDFNIKDLRMFFGKKDIDVKFIKSFSYWYLFNDAVKTDYETIDKAQGKIRIIYGAPVGDDFYPVSSIYVKKGSDKESTKRIICTAMNKCFEKSDGAQACSIEYEVSDISQANGFGIGSGTAITKAPGGDTTYTLGATLGGATSKANDFRGGYFEITFWNKCPKEIATPVVTETEVVRKNQIEILNIENVKEVFFELNSYELKEKSQFEAIESMVIFIDNHIKNLQPNQIFCIFGKASKPGTEDLNRDLGWNRAEKTYIHVLRDLHNKKGYELSYLKSKIQFATDGKAFPYHEKDEHNQEACLKVLQN